jgi:hypothetical protein
VRSLEGQVGVERLRAGGLSFDKVDTGIAIDLGGMRSLKLDPALLVIVPFGRKRVEELAELAVACAAEKKLIPFSVGAVELAAAPRMVLTGGKGDVAILPEDLGQGLEFFGDFVAPDVLVFNIPERCVRSAGRRATGSRLPGKMPP